MPGGIVDIEQLQNHGNQSVSPVHILILMGLAIGIGASDILKLKAAGYWTVAVFLKSPEHSIMSGLLRPSV